MADFAGLPGIEAATAEAAGASGGAAIRMGYLAVSSGQADVALVLGVEKFTDQIGSLTEAALATAGDSDYEAVQGLTPTAQAALLMRRYMHEFGVTHGSFRGFRFDGARQRRRQSECHVSQGHHAGYLSARAGVVSDPLNLFDVAPSADGAAALVLTRPELLPPNFPQPLVSIAGSSLVTDTLALHDRPDPLDPTGGAPIGRTRLRTSAHYRRCR